MPLTAKGEEIKAALVKEYGEKKGEQVLYAGENKGTFTGIHADSDPAGLRGIRLDACLAGMKDTLDRMDAYCARTDNQELEKQIITLTRTAASSEDPELKEAARKRLIELKKRL